MYLREVTVGVDVCVCLAHLIVTAIHFGVKASFALLLSLFFLLLFVLVLLFYALLPHADHT